MCAAYYESTQNCAVFYEYHGIELRKKNELMDHITQNLSILPPGGRDTEKTTRSLLLCLSES